MAKRLSLPGKALRACAARVGMKARRVWSAVTHHRSANRHQALGPSYVTHGGHPEDFRPLDIADDVDDVEDRPPPYEMEAPPPYQEEDENVDLSLVCNAAVRVQLRRRRLQDYYLRGEREHAGEL